jgi:hypothetical protein
VSKIIDITNSGEPKEVDVINKDVDKHLTDIELNTNRTESLLCALLEEQQKTNKLLRKIYNPD